MEITTRTYGCFIAELIVTDGNDTLTTDLAHGNKVDCEIIKQLSDAAIEFSRFNDTTDVEHLFNIASEHLHESEIEELIELLQNKIAS